MSKKYELTSISKVVNGCTVYRIKALKDFGDVEKGNIGGYIQSEKNLSQEDDCWIFDNAIVYDNAEVYGDAKIFGNAEVYGDAILSENANIESNDDFSIIYNFGSINRVTSFFKCEDGLIKVNCGCFHGTIDEFRE